MSAQSGNKKIIKAFVNIDLNGPPILGKEQSSMSPEEVKKLGDMLKAINKQSKLNKELCSKHDDEIKLVKKIKKVSEAAILNMETNDGGGKGRNRAPSIIESDQVKAMQKIQLTARKYVDVGQKSDKKGAKKGDRKDSQAGMNPNGEGLPPPKEPKQKSSIAQPSAPKDSAARKSSNKKKKAQEQEFPEVGKDIDLIELDCYEDDGTKKKMKKYEKRAIQTRGRREATVDPRDDIEVDDLSDKLVGAGKKKKQQYNQRKEKNKASTSK